MCVCVCVCVCVSVSVSVSVREREKREREKAGETQVDQNKYRLVSCFKYVAYIQNSFFCLFSL